MPEKRRQYTQWNAERFIRRAAGAGPHTEQAVKAIFAFRKAGQQGCKKIDLLILDERLLPPLAGLESRDLLEVAEAQGC
jgi:hypothetical protein